MPFLAVDGLPLCVSGKATWNRPPQASGCGGSSAPAHNGYPDGEGAPHSIGWSDEVYTVRRAIWAKAGMKPYGGCLCIGFAKKSKNHIHGNVWFVQVLSTKKSAKRGYRAKRAGRGLSIPHDESPFFDHELHTA